MDLVRRFAVVVGRGSSLSMLVWWQKVTKATFRLRYGWPGGCGVTVLCRLETRCSVELYLHDACVDLLEQSLPSPQLLLLLGMNEVGVSAGASVSGCISVSG